MKEQSLLKVHLIVTASTHHDTALAVSQVTHCDGYRQSYGELQYGLLTMIYALGRTQAPGARSEASYLLSDSEGRKCGFSAYTGPVWWQTASFRNGEMYL